MIFLYDIGTGAYCGLHRVTKRALRRSQSLRADFAYCYTREDAERVFSRCQGRGFLEVSEDVAEGKPAVSLKRPFWGENIVGIDESEQVGAICPWRVEAYSKPEDAWRGFVSESTVPGGWANSGLHAVCWSRDLGQWVLSSWIWTSAALARYYASIDDLENLARVADALLALQLPNGGWVVRHDFIGGFAVPMVAPNDSAYIANNAMLCAYDKLGHGRYLASAERCAGWIMDTARPDGLVHIGQNGYSGEWITSANIVDIGFTSALFARLLSIVGRKEYGEFLARFIKAYVAVFRNVEDGSFATSIDGSGNRRGGKFARGQAWALEGLAPAAAVLDSAELDSVVEGVVNVLLSSQMKDGGWAYNISHPLMGQDCKGVPVIAKALAEWGASHSDASAVAAAKGALNWSRAHTLLNGPGAGGIYSFCLEGCVTHHLYSEAAFTYASSYALETMAILERVGVDR